MAELNSIAKATVQNHRMPAADRKSSANQVKVNPVPSKEKGNAERVSLELVSKSIENINGELQSLDSPFNVKYRVHDGTDRVIVQLFDKADDHVVLEFPSTKILDFASGLRTRSNSIAVDEKL